jgi:lipopolysaccharide/colanic/teichoic acid biosynthesis glycosyltransferase
MRGRLPSSRTRVFSRIAAFDVIWAGISPILAFIIRDGAINRVDDVIVYGVVSLAVSVAVFQFLRISDAIPSFFSVHDAVNVFKACLLTVAITAAILFVLTRLDYAPRSVPIIHFLVLGCGLIGIRAWRRLRDPWNKAQRSPSRGEDLEPIVVVGATRLTWLFSKMLDELYPRDHPIVAIVDERQQLLHRTINGHPVVALPEDLARILDEYATHGISVSKVVVAAHPNDLSEQTRNGVPAACRARNIPVEWLHETFLVPQSKPAKRPDLLSAADGATAVGSYWQFKRVIDVVVALALMIAFAPLTLVVAALVFIDVGSPLVFWQQRIGRHGRPLHVYKFRTMRSTFDRSGRPVPEQERLSALGRYLRTTHLDEIPQLVNIFTGSMSLIGPRPLLPVDQPKDIRFRLHVRPGLTGLAQISGGTMLSPDEKDALDDWYVQHASLWLDVKILLRTLWVIVRGNPRDDIQISAALAERYMNTQGAAE